MEEQSSCKRPHAGSSPALGPGREEKKRKKEKEKEKEKRKEKEEKKKEKKEKSKVGTQTPDLTPPGGIQ